MHQVRALRVHLTLVDHIYGEYSVEKAASAFKLADSYSELGYRFYSPSLSLSPPLSISYSLTLTFPSLYFVALLYSRSSLA